MVHGKLEQSAEQQADGENAGRDDIGQVQSEQPGVDLAHVEHNYAELEDDRTGPAVIQLAGPE